MGAISIGVKRKSSKHWKTACFEWDTQDDWDKVVAVDLENSDIYTVEEFCAGYRDKKHGESQLAMYREEKCKYVIYTRRFYFGITKKEAKKTNYNFMKKFYLIFLTLTLPFFSVKAEEITRDEAEGYCMEADLYPDMTNFETCVDDIINEFNK